MNQESIKSAGTLDLSFGTNGVVIMPKGATEILALTDNKLLVITEWVSTALPYRVVRFTEAGVLDTSFGNGGVVEIPFELGINFYPGKMCALQEGGYLITGARKGASDKLFVVRLLEDGALDAAFGEAGVVTLRALDIGENTKFFGSTDDWKTVGDADVVGTPLMAVSERNAKIYVGASLLSDNAFKGIVFCLNDDGSMDTNFNGGHVFIEAPDAHVSLGSMAVQGDGVLVGGVGFVSNGPEGDAFVTRYDRTGMIDNLFGNGGTTRIPNGHVDRRSRLVSMALNRNDGILASGYSIKGGVVEGLITVLDSDGTLDSSFNGGEPVQETFLADLIFWGCDWQQDEKLIVTGTGDGGCLVVARFDLDGSLDLSFGGTGWTEFRDKADSRHHKSELTADNKIVILGRTPVGEEFVVRYLG